MKKIYLFNLIILILLPTSIISQTQVSSIIFKSLSKTDPAYLKQFLELKEGDEFDSIKLAADEQFLKNIQYYKDVSCSVKTSRETTDITFYLNEKTTVLPMVNFNYIRDNLLLKFGVTDYNFLGSWNIIGGYYQYYDRNSFEIFQHTPYLFGTRLGVKTRYAKFSTIEPAYFESGKSFFDVDRNVFGSAFSYNFSNIIGRGDQIIFTLGADYLEEKYKKNISRSGNNSPGPDFDKHQKLLLKSSISIESINYFFEQSDGFSNKLFYEVVSEKNDLFGFHKFLNDLRFYKKLSVDDNFAIRFRFGISTNKNSPFIPFVIDNYINVRGAGDRVARGSAELTLNIEYRRTIKSLSWAAVQLVAFSDISTIRPGGSSLDKLFENQNFYSTVGAGVRIHLFDFYNVIFRLDYGINIKNLRTGGLVIGMNQYF